MPIFVGTYYYIHIQRFSIAGGAVIVFMFLFYFLAPILQLDNDSYELINNAKYDTDLLLCGNLFVFVFLTTYFIALFIILQNTTLKVHVGKFSSNSVRMVYILFFFSVIIAQRSYNEMAIIISTFQLELDADERIVAMFQRKVLYMIPFVTMSVYILTKKKNFYVFVGFIILLFLVFLTKNPLLDRRNAIGPVYISLLIFVFKKKINSNIKIFALLFVMMVVLFPLSSLLTHISIDEWGEKSVNYGELIKEHFVDLHYDAWANIPASILYVRKNGYAFGNQLLGTITFWVPRSIWECKPISTGELIGNFLMQFEGLHFNNISSTLIVEGYIDFGIFGIILYGFILALFVVWLEKMYNTERIYDEIFSVYSSIFIFFILRGALMPAVAYLTGAWISIVLIPSLFNKVIILFKFLKVK
ncbi:hypothetical protein GCM10011514_30630 [Emticicia aquatilis]|uniref:Oligosaccharide repeat unit polymerase n=1 Tax=Emticicia aquatilis TaxID=1537369 RepID=A0A916YW38_9BACT|nr:hypothetical protein GCM10011514_30630 [Emticicia aquatilis]